jgi:hypothetical protein
MTSRILRAGLLYWVIVFTLGFVLGTIRVLAIAPALGNETKAVILELPVMLLASWASARWIVRRFEPMGRAAWLGAGGFAFAMLMAAEAALAAMAFGQSPGEWTESLFVVPGIIGLAGQAAFALMPALAGGARA